MHSGRIYIRLLIFLIAVMGSVSSLSAQSKHSKRFENLLRKTASPLLLKILNQPEKYRCQIIYTEINRDKHNQPRFKYHYFNVNADQYFYPASTVKLPAVLAALQKLNHLNIPKLDKYAVMFTDSATVGQTKVVRDSSSENGLPSLAQYIKKIFLVSDNDAYNRLYEFCGQKYLNETLWEKGYRNSRIVKRFVPLTEEQNRRTNPVRFYHGEQLLYAQAEQNSNLDFDFSKKAMAGEGYQTAQGLVKQPMDFTRHNRFPLEDQQQMLQTLMFPGTSMKVDFDLNADDRAFLYTYMSMLPRQSRFPSYDSAHFYDSYAKFCMSRPNEERFPEYIRVFNKAGWAYGFMTDNSYIADTRNGVEFMLAATIYVNEDNILNDDKYDYLTVGYPFFQEISNTIYQHELKRKKKYSPHFAFEE